MSASKSNFYGWWRKGTKGYIRLAIDQFSMSFIAAVSETKIYGVTGVDGSANAEIVIHFLKELCEARSISVHNRQTPFIIWLDNAPFHTAAAVEDFAKKTNLKLLTITPYSPILNPWEKLIQILKRKLKVEHQKGR